MRIQLSIDTNQRVVVDVSALDDLEASLERSHDFPFEDIRSGTEVAVEVFGKKRPTVSIKLRNYGKKLYKSLFPEKSTSWTLLQNILKPQVESLVLLEFYDDKNYEVLDGIPWEYTWVKKEYLVRLCMFTRVDKRAGFEPLPPSPMRIVVVAPDPWDSLKVGMPDLHLSDQFQNFINEYKKNSRKVTLERAIPATVNKMDALLSEKQSDSATVLHFMGHCVEHVMNSRALVFENHDTGKHDKVSPRRLVSEPKKLRLAFLSACNSREVARTLVQQGVQYTIGSYCSLPDDIARKFEAQFYYYLAKGLSVDKAMFKARMDIADLDDHRQRDYLVGAMILYSTTSRASQDGLFLSESGDPHYAYKTNPDNLDAKLHIKTTFWGHEEEFDRVNTALRRMVTRTHQSHRVCTITGISGQGKTMLAAKVMTHIKHIFPSGIFAWTFDVEQNISATAYLRELVKVLSPKKVDILFPGGKPASDIRSEGYLQQFKREIFKDKFPSLLIVDQADTLKHAKHDDATFLLKFFEDISTDKDILVSILATAHVKLAWSSEKVVNLENFLTDIDNGKEVFRQHLWDDTADAIIKELKNDDKPTSSEDEEAKTTMEDEEDEEKMEEDKEKVAKDEEMTKKAKEKFEELMCGLVKNVDGHPLCLKLLSEVANSAKPGHKLEIFGENKYISELKFGKGKEQLDNIFRPIIARLTLQQRLLLHICSNFKSDKPVKDREITAISKFYSGSSGIIEHDLDQLCGEGLLLKDDKDQYRVHITVRIVTDPSSSEFKHRKPSTDDMTLYNAATEGFSGLVKFLLNDSKRSYTTDDGQASLHVAVEKGHCDVIELLLEKYGHTTDKDGQTALHVAARQKIEDVVELLINFFQRDGDFNVDVKDSHGRTPLHGAVEQGHVKVVALLMKSNANVNAVDEYERTPLHYAAGNGKDDIMKLLVSEFGANAEAQDINGRTPLHLAAEKGHIEVVRLLGATVKAQDINGRTPLHLAAGKGHVEVVRLLGALGANANAEDKDGRTPLHGTAGEEHERLLVTNANAKDGDPKMNKYAEVVRVLVEEFGADRNVKTRDGCVPLHAAAEQGDVEAVRLFVETYKAEVDALDNHRRTPLYRAAGKGHLDVVTLLVDTFEADVNAKAYGGRTPLFIAAGKGHVDVVKFLLTKFEGWPNVKTNDGQTPLHEAAKEGHVEVVELLRKKCSNDIATEDDCRMTPLHYAEEYGRDDVVKYLKRTRELESVSQDTESTKKKKRKVSSSRDRPKRII